MKREGLKNENELQSYFVRRIEKFLNAHGRKLVGWDEILEGGVAPNAVVMSWHGMEGGVTAANAGHDVVMTPTDELLLRLSSGENRRAARMGRRSTAENRLCPSRSRRPSRRQGRSMSSARGGNMWTELIPDYARSIHGLSTRLRVAEVTWSDPKLKNWRDFRNRLEVHLQRLNAQGVNYRRLRPDDIVPGAKQ